jgi:hypothetical protein
MSEIPATLSHQLQVVLSEDGDYLESERKSIKQGSLTGLFQSNEQASATHRFQHLLTLTLRSLRHNFTPAVTNICYRFSLFMITVHSTVTAGSFSNTLLVQGGRAERIDVRISENYGSELPKKGAL